MASAEPSSLRYWQEQLVQQFRTGRLRYLQRISVVCSALEPRTSHSSSLPTSPNTQENNGFGEQRLYIENPFLQPNLHRCVVCIKKRSLTLKRILAALAAEDLGSLLEGKSDRDNADVPLSPSSSSSSSSTPSSSSSSSPSSLSPLSSSLSSQSAVLPLVLGSLYMHLVHVKGEAAIEVEQVLRTTAHSKIVAKQWTGPHSLAQVINAILDRTLRFTEPLLLSPSNSLPDSSSSSISSPSSPSSFSSSVSSPPAPLPAFDTAPLSVYMNELLELVYLERWATVHNAKALIESIQGVMDKSLTADGPSKGRKLPPVTTQEGWDEHISTSFNFIYDYQFRSPNIVIAHLKHLYILHHPTSQRKGPRGYRAWWEGDRNRCLTLFVKLLQNASTDLNDQNNQDIIRYTYYLLAGWAYQQQPHEKNRKTGKRKEHDGAPLDLESAKSIVEAAEIAKLVLSARDNNFVPSLVFLFLSVGLLRPFSQEIGRTPYLYITELLSDASWADYITSHARISDILIPFADFLAVLRDPEEIRESISVLLSLWHGNIPTFHDMLLVSAILKVASANASHSSPNEAELETWYSVVSADIHERFRAPQTDSVRLTSLFAASGVLKGIPSVDYPHVYILLQEVIVLALHTQEFTGINVELNDLWTSAVALALAHSGLCSKTTPLDLEHDVPKALDILTQVLVTDVLGEWIFRADTQSSNPFVNQGHSLDIHLTPARAHAHAKTAHYGSSSAFTSSIARLFAVLPLDHPSRDSTIHRFHAHSKMVYDSWREFTHRTEESYTDSSVVTTSLLPIVQVAQLAITLFCFYISQTNTAKNKPTSLEPSFSKNQDSKKSAVKGLSSHHAVDAIDALGYLEFAGADVPRFYTKLANLFLVDQTTREENVKELIYRIPIPASAYSAFQSVDATQAVHPPKDGKALLARVAFLLRVIEPLAPIVDVDTLTNRLIPVAFALLPHTSEQVRRSAHAVLHSLLANAPVSLAQSLVPSYCRVALTSAMVDDVPVPSTNNNSQSADYLYESMAAIFRRMSPPVALLAVKALAAAAMNTVVSSSDSAQHKKLILLLLSQTVAQVDISLLDMTLAEIDKVVQAAPQGGAYTLLLFLHRVVSRSSDYVRKARLARWFLHSVNKSPLQQHNNNNNNNKKHLSSR